MEFWSGMEFLVSLVFIITTSSWAKDSVLDHEFFKSYAHCNMTKKMVYLPKDKRQKIEKASNIKNLPGVVKSYQIKCRGEGDRNVFLVSDRIRTHYQKAFVEIQNDQVKKLKWYIFLSLKNIWHLKILFRNFLTNQILKMLTV